MVDVMRGHQATESPECSTEEGFAITSILKGAIFSGDINWPFLNTQAFEKIAPRDEGLGNRQ